MLWNHSDRWLHRLIAEQTTLNHLAADDATRPMIKQRLKVVMAHGDNPQTVTNTILKLWDCLCDPKHHPPGVSHDHQSDLPNFLALMQNLSFLARDLET